MRICVAHFSYHPTTGEVESELFEQCAELNRQGHEVFVLTGTVAHSPATETIGGMQIFRFDWMNLEHVRERKKQAGYAPRVVRPELLSEIRENFQSFFGQHACDLVHAHNFHHFLPEYAMALSQLHDEGLPTILTLHEVWNDSLCEEILHNTEWDAIIAVSKHVAVSTRLQAPHLENLRVLYPGVDTNVFTPGIAAESQNLRNEIGAADRPIIFHPRPWFRRKQFSTPSARLIWSALSFRTSCSS